MSGECARRLRVCYVPGHSSYCLDQRVFEPRRLSWCNRLVPAMVPWKMNGCTSAAKETVATVQKTQITPRRASCWS